MANAETTPGAEEKKLNADGTPATKVVETEVKEPKVGDIVNPDNNGKKDAKADDKPETVGLDKFLELKGENKELKKAVKSLQDKIEEGGVGKGEISDDLDEIAKEFNVDKGFLNKLKKALGGKQVPKEADDKVSGRLEKLEAEKKQESIDKAFTKHFEKAMEKMPEFKSVVNAEVIKTLSLDPRNADKTFTEIIEETYGKAIPAGRRTIEKTTPGGGKEPTEIDFDRAVKDGAYYKELMADPALKKKYNDGIEKRIRL